MNTNAKTKMPLDRFLDYFFVFLKQLITNHEYACFLLAGLLLEVAYLRTVNLTAWLVLTVFNTLVGTAAIASIVRPINKAFETIGLNYNTGYGYPTWIIEGKYPARLEVIRIRSAGYAASDFQHSIEQLSSRISQPIKEIRKPDPTKPILEIVLSHSEIPSKLSFDKLDLSLLKNGEFFIGQSDKQLEKTSLKQMIHMLVAGQTGAGKTQFIRQLMTTILTSTKNAHVCLIDMKAGIDFQQFEGIPNFESALNYESADKMLDALNAIFELRYSVLKEKKKEHWNELTAKELEQTPALQNKPIGPILVVIDELAELTKKASQNSAKSELQDKIATLARLSRFTSIHLIMGSQRPDKAVINMQVKDNAPSRICFSVPSVAASNLVIGDMSAATLGGHPGRAIFQFYGNKIIQAPYITNDKIKELMDFHKKQLIQSHYNRYVLDSNSKDEKVKGIKVKIS